jgi:DNA-binding LacI/PurR family transcriptional regulator
MADDVAGRVTIRDIAERAGVSKGAVSYALNGRPGVSDDTRGRILAIAHELGWYPNRAARALSAARADAVGLVLARPARTLALEPFFMEFIAGVERELSAHSIALTLQLVHDVDQEIAIYRRWWGEHRVDGVLMVDLRVEDPRVEELVRLGLPAVVVGGPLENGRLPAVWHDEAAVIVEAVQYLAALGHRRLAEVTGDGEFVHTRQRADAFRRATGEFELDARVVETDYSAEQGARDAQAAVVAGAAHGDHLRQRPARRHRPRRRPADGVPRARGPVHRRLGRLADQPGRPPAADGHHARHRSVRDRGGEALARQGRRRSGGGCRDRSAAARRLPAAPPPDADRPAARLAAKSG